MGMLYYGTADSPVHIDDVLLAHLKVVMLTKLRRGESFTVAWPHDEHSPSGRTTLWIAPSIALRFLFDSPEPAALDPRRIRDLADQVSRTGSLSLPALFTPAVGAGYAQRSVPARHPRQGTSLSRA
ncbi:hypothetical protein NQ156_03915 [Microbacterium sp. zg.Y625]|uniref:DUF7882 family protein n=1 Tax=Microbacterium jiangjiandongii TaxID=3049071 RepID=UPI00214C9A61|nr:MULTISPECIES: hypothetical protein [unclassified Microbacterium]MCR2792205.1 hypothetical protein [Microbacterium sp. zg.Y625]MCR2814994.1 hypothetical protein [Microbacterium sp. zg.Y843]WIM25008.1 hypothetical protein QNO14_12825 [Microbacterium sp. zg-Y625]